MNDNKKLRTYTGLCIHVLAGYYYPTKIQACSMSSKSMWFTSPGTVRVNHYHRHVDV